MGRGNAGWQRWWSIGAAIAMVAVALTSALPVAEGQGACTAPPGMQLHRWIGGASGAYGTPGNWSTGEVPGLVTYANPTAGFANDSICVPAGSTVLANQIDTGREFHVHATVLGNLVVGTGVKFFVSGGANASRITNLTLEPGSLLGGDGDLTIIRSFTMRAGGAAGASTVTTRDFDEISTSPPARKGKLIIGPNATALLTGPTPTAAAPINIRDGRVVDIRGRATLRTGVTIGADWGTRTVVRAPTTTTNGLLRLEGGARFDEGRLRPELGWPTAKPILDNNGVVERAGTGRSLISARFVDSPTIAGTGTYRVVSGALDLYTENQIITLTAEVAPGGSLANAATCQACAPTASAADEEAAVFENRSGVLADVTLGERATTRGAVIGGDLVLTDRQIEVQAAARIAGPIAGSHRIRIIIDASRFHVADLSKLRVARNNTKLPLCTSTNPATPSPCTGPASLRPDGDAEIVVYGLVGSFVNRASLRPLGPRLRG